LTEADEEHSDSSIESEGELAMLAAAAYEEKIKKARKPPMCPICKTNHFLVKCKRFEEMSPQARRDIIARSKRCFICFKEHQVKECTYKRTCKQCDGKHHPLLHIAVQVEPTSSELEEDPPPESADQ
jgi:hypothetical protein